MGPPSSAGVARAAYSWVSSSGPVSRARRRSRQKALHYFAEAGKLAYADRARYLGDPAFRTVPDHGRCSMPSYLDKRAKLIGERAMPLAPPGDIESGHQPFLDRRCATATSCR